MGILRNIVTVTLFAIGAANGVLIAWDVKTVIDLVPTQQPLTIEYFRGRHGLLIIRLLWEVMTTILAISHFITNWNRTEEGGGNLEFTHSMITYGWLAGPILTSILTGTLYRLHCTSPCP